MIEIVKNIFIQLNEKRKSFFKKHETKIQLLILGLFLFPIYVLVNTRRKLHVEAENKTKRRLKYFNPIIKKGIIGDEYIEWIGREKPLTDEEVELLIKNT